MRKYIPVIALERLPEQGFIPLEVEGRSLLVGRARGQVFAILDICPHAAFPLRGGSFRGSELQCPKHGWEFDVLTGEAVPEPSAFKLKRYSVKIKDGQVLVAL